MYFKNFNREATSGNNSNTENTSTGNADNSKNREQFQKIPTMAVKVYRIKKCINP